MRRLPQRTALPLHKLHNACLLKNTLRKKHKEETQTLHAGCSKVEPSRRPTSRGGGQDGQNLISFTYNLLYSHTALISYSVLVVSFDFGHFKY